MHPLKNQEYTYALWVTNPNVVSLQWTSASQPPLDTRQGMLKARKICRCSMNGYNLLKTLQLNVACGSFILANTEGLHPTSHWSSFRSSHHGSPWISMDLHGFLATHVPLHHDEMLQWRKEAAEVGPMDRILAPKESSVRRDVFRFLWWTHLDFTKKNCEWIRSGQHNLVGDWATPLKHIRQLERLSHILWKINFMFETTNQSLFFHDFPIIFPLKHSIYSWFSVGNSEHLGPRSPTISKRGSTSTVVTASAVRHTEGFHIQHSYRGFHGI